MMLSSSLLLLILSNIDRISSFLLNSRSAISFSASRLLLSMTSNMNTIQVYSTLVIFFSFSSLFFS